MSGNWYTPPGLLGSNSSSGNKLTLKGGGNGLLAPAVHTCQYCNQECAYPPGRIEITAPGDSDMCFSGCLACLGEAVKEWVGNPDECKCSIRDLQITGCICGAFKKEQNAKVQASN